MEARQPWLAAKEREREREVRDRTVGRGRRRGGQVLNSMRQDATAIDIEELDGADREAEQRRLLHPSCASSPSWCISQAGSTFPSRQVIEKIDC